MAAVGIIGPGRAGLGLALALARAGHEVKLHGRSPRSVPPPLTLTTGPIPPWLDATGVVVIAVPDDAISGLAASLAQTGKVGARHVILHLSGVLDRNALQALAKTGAGLGSLHPLQSLSDPATAPERLSGAFAGVEGDDRAASAAADLARSVGLKPFRLSAGKKACYHAGAVTAANFLVTLYGTAEKLFTRAGVPPPEARAALLALMRGVLENVQASGAAGALTGPVARGDAKTVRLHLEALDGREAELYRALSRATLELAALPEDKRRALLEAISDDDGR